mmetsp:Transcript_24189/g.47575  ORF Transcript_24189/g.47575 Transcript_24189/m.47575 type:complete len:311 (+) Transcript_24189:425-1357(+)
MCGDDGIPSLQRVGLQKSTQNRTVALPQSTPSVYVVMCHPLRPKKIEGLPLLLSERESVHLHSMALYGVFELPPLLEAPHISTSPEVTNTRNTASFPGPHVQQREGHRSGSQEPIPQNHHDVTAVEGSCPNECALLRLHNFCLHAKFVLIDSDDLLVFQNGQALIGDGLEVAPNHKGRLHGSPQREMGPLLSKAQTAISHLQHVRIIPPARCCVLRPLIVLQGDPRHRRPEVLDILRRPPAVGHLCRPSRGILLPPVAHAVEDRPPRLVQSVSHGCVPGSCWLFVVVAVVILQVVHFPLCVHLRVHLLKS